MPLNTLQDRATQLPQHALAAARWGAAAAGGAHGGHPKDEGRVGFPIGFYRVPIGLYRVPLGLYRVPIGLYRFPIGSDRVPM